MLNTVATAPMMAPFSSRTGAQMGTIGLPDILDFTACPTLGVPEIACLKYLRSPIERFALMFSPFAPSAIVVPVVLTTRIVS